MSLQSFSFFPFLAVTAFLYLRLPARWQTPGLLAASAVFYGFQLRAGYLTALVDAGPAAAVFRLVVSVAAVLIALAVTHFGALAIAAQKGEARSRLLRRCVVLLLAVLALFKYFNASPLPALLEGLLPAPLPFPVGISFFTFAAIGYLTDVAREDCAPELDPAHTAVFLFFFGTVLSGPICRGGQLLPQLRQEHRFDEERTVNALRLFALGLFQKVAVADVLALLVNEVFIHTGRYGALLHLLAAALYTVVLLYDFSGYSNMARAVGLLLGIDLPENFRTPFFATNFSGFWARWHISLSSWLQDYLFMPLAWLDVERLPLAGKRLARRWPRLPVELCVFCVFFFSGFWHGNTLPFVVWGLLQAVFRVGEELCHRRFGKPKRKGVPARVLWAKRLGVFWLFTGSLVLFRVGSGPGTATLADAAAFFQGFLGSWSPILFVQELWSAIAAGFYAKPIMQLAWLGFSALTTGIAVYLDTQRFFRFKDKPLEQVLAGQKTLVRRALYYALVLGIFIGYILQNGGFAGGQSFAYAGF